MAKAHKRQSFYTLYNEIDGIIYDGTPLFEYATDALDWWERNDKRPSTKLVSATIVFTPPSQ